ncbi:hypothetical protein FHR36_001976 [Kitasatospora paracochleata]|uniref:Uncharacterized protein n=1 Tax=Kitasatospora paracochleata TaxID=58354 RepID=A0ABT1IUP4_9ACTN|nr:hypothetical protein [Kitasatospora paracochleata]
MSSRAGDPLGRPPAARARVETGEIGADRKAMLNKYARAFFTRVLTPFAALLLRWGVSPDAVTLIGTAGSVAVSAGVLPPG